MFTNYTKENNDRSPFYLFDWFNFKSFGMKTLGKPIDEHRELFKVNLLDDLTLNKKTIFEYKWWFIGPK